MQNQTFRRNTALALGALALLGGSILTAPARAQDAGAAATAEPSRPISLNLINVPVQAALRTLFSAAGIKNYSIKSDVQGFANINVSEVPFSLALRQLLSSVNPPLSYTVDNGTYVVSVQQAAPPPAPTIVTPVATPDAGGDAGAGTNANAPKRFYRIPIDKYDAYYIARLLGATGIVQVGVNDVIAANGASGGGNTGGQGGFGQNWVRADLGKTAASAATRAPSAAVSARL